MVERTGKTIRHGTRSGYQDRGCRCTECRAWNAASMRAYIRKVKAESGRSPTQKYRPARRRKCFDCGKVLKGGGWAGDGKPRCVEHRRAAKARADRAASRRRRAFAKLSEAAEGVRANRRWPFVQGVCRHCAEIFTRRGASSSYCSRRCRLKDRPSGAWISRSDRLAVYDRDGWVCQLCFEPVGREADHLDDWAPSLDHIEPQSVALIPDHSLANLRTAHRWCNSVRGDGTWNSNFFEEVA